MKRFLTILLLTACTIFGAAGAVLPGLLPSHIYRIQHSTISNQHLPTSVPISHVYKHTTTPNHQDDPSVFVVIELDTVSTSDHHEPFIAFAIIDLSSGIVNLALVPQSAYRAILADPAKYSDPTGLETFIVEVDTEKNCKKHYDKVQTYLKQLRKMRSLVASLSKEQFAETGVRWDTTEFKGEKSDLLALLDKELETRYLGVTIYGSDSFTKERTENATEFQQRIWGFIGDSWLFPIKRGNVTTSPSIVFIAHGIVERGVRKTLLDEVGNQKALTQRMNDIYQAIANKTRAPVINSTCYNNHLELPEKIPLTGGRVTIVGAKGSGLGLSVDLLKVSVSAWRPKRDTDVGPRVDKHRKVFNRGKITNEKTFLPSPIMPSPHVLTTAEKWLIILEDQTAVEARVLEHPERIRQERELLVP